eukprot:scaffold303174_cov30-Tisochrysis_lutea.AAC.1
MAGRAAPRPELRAHASCSPLVVFTPSHPHLARLDRIPPYGRYKEGCREILQRACDGIESTRSLRGAACYRRERHRGLRVLLPAKSVERLRASIERLGRHWAELQCRVCVGESIYWPIGH